MLKRSLSLDGIGAVKLVNRDKITMTKNENNSC